MRAAHKISKNEILKNEISKKWAGKKKDKLWKSFLNPLQAFLRPVADPFKMDFPSLPVRVKKHEHFKGKLPDYKSKGASGFDIRACLDGELELLPGKRAIVPTGLSFELPPGFELQARPRSGLALNQGLTVLNSPGTIDSDYRGEIKVLLLNTGAQNIKIKDQDRVAQLVLCPVFKAEFTEWGELSESQRGKSGFGSTGL